MDQNPPQKPALTSLPHPQLERFVVDELGLARYRADQIFSWLHGRMATAFDQMTNLKKDIRRMLAARTRIETLTLVKTQKSADGVVKLALQTHDNHLIETVLIPEGEKITQCISTQVGCRMGCAFCATAKLGFQRNLTAGEIVAQVYAGRHAVEKSNANAPTHNAADTFAHNSVTASPRRISNLVYMGMGEPLDNYAATIASLQILLYPRGANFSTRRITVSTAGHVAGLAKLGREPCQVNLAVSLNATDQKTRATLMPIARKWPLATLLSTLKSFPLEKRRRITFEYVLIEGVNASLQDAHRLARLLRGLRAKVNVIRLNPFWGCRLKPPSLAQTLRFQQALRSHDLTVLLRKSRGAEIQAGCGQLAGASRK
jgi:23S rRNA (adenine2503-C2)-methyltransferase